MYVQFEGVVSRQTVGILAGAGCAPLVADLFLYCCGGILCLTCTGLSGVALLACLAVPLGAMAVCSPSVALGLRNIVLIYIQQASAEQSKYFFPWF